jgi:hypothetical protein
LPGKRLFWFTDSIYFLDPQELLYMLRRTNGVAYGCSHVFPVEDTTIAIPSDAVQEGVAIIKKGMVTMHVEGNPQVYHHPAFSFPSTAIRGTLFNARFGSRAIATNQHRLWLNNHGHALSFQMLYSCGTYSGWRAIVVPVSTLTEIPPEMRDFRMSTYTAECIAMRASTPTDVTMIVTKMVSRKKGDRNQVLATVAETLAQLEQVGKPLVRKDAKSIWSMILKWCKSPQGEDDQHPQEDDDVEEDDDNHPDCDHQQGPPSTHTTVTGPASPSQTTTPKVDCPTLAEFLGDKTLPVFKPKAAQRHPLRNDTGMGGLGMGNLAALPGLPRLGEPHRVAFLPRPIEPPPQNPPPPPPPHPRAQPNPEVKDGRASPPANFLPQNTLIPGPGILPPVRVKLEQTATKKVWMQKAKLKPQH